MKLFAHFVVAAATLVLWVGSAQTQEKTQDEESITVVGSYIPRQVGNASSPLAIVEAEDIGAIGAGTIADITQFLTINTGAQNNSDAFTQNVSTGTSNINLRGLGVSSTLVLLNGHRQVVSGANTDLGLLFVDTSSLVPMIAIDRVEVLKDGAASLYGSDAVAGVVNFVTRKDFEGFEFSAFGQTVTEDSQADFSAEGIAGFDVGRAHVVAAVSYFHRSSLTTAERRFPGSLDPVNGDFSNAGFPGSYVVPFLPTGLSGPVQAAWNLYFDTPNGSIPNIANAIEPLLGLPFVAGSLTPVMTDPNCAAGENSVVPATFPLGFCRLDFGDYYDLVPQERRLLGYVNVDLELTDRVSFSLEISGARNRATRNNSPSFPIPTAIPMLANNPFSPFGPSPDVDPGPGVTRLPIFFIGRSIGEGPGALSSHDSDTLRFFGGFKGTFSENGTWALSVTHAENDFRVQVADVLADRFALAVNGLGGENCTGGIPGLGGCEYFNTFGSSLTASPGATVSGPYGGTQFVRNDDHPELIDWFTGLFTRDYTSNLTVVDAVLTNEITGVLPDPISYAVGFQYRKDKYGLDLDEDSNNDNYLFVKGGPDFLASQNAFAFFSELNIPLHEKVTLQAALRYENYNTAAGDTLDPKVGLFVRAHDTLTLRGSFGTSFRAPNIFQQFGSLTAVQQLIDSLPGQPTTPQFFAVRSSGNAELKPESAKNYNAGATWEPTDRLRFDIDWWRFAFEDIIVQESAQAIIDANPLDPKIDRSLVTGGITQVNVDFVNASSLVTSGIDLAAKYRIPLNGMGDIVLGLDATHILNYDLVDPQAGFVSGEGRRNFRNFGTSTPQWRVNGMINWVKGPHEVYLYSRTINGYQDDQNDLPIDGHTTFDFQYNLTLGDMDNNGVRLTLGVINMFNNFPPTVLTNLGFDTKVHDPRGRMVYAKLTKDF